MDQAGAKVYQLLLEPKFWVLLSSASGSHALLVELGGVAFVLSASPC